MFFDERPVEISVSYSSAFGIPTSPPFGIGAWGAPAFAPIPGMCAVAG